MSTRRGHSTTSDDADDDGGSGGGGISAGAVAAALGIGGGALTQLGDFADRLAEAGSFPELIINVLLVEGVNLILSAFEYIFGQILLAINVISESFWLSIVTPIGALGTTVWDVVFGTLESVQTTTEVAVASTGIAAPFVALAGWVAMLLVAAVLIGIVWALLETYLPVEVIENEIRRLAGLTLLPFSLLEEFLRDLLAGDDDDGGSDNEA